MDKEQEQKPLNESDASSEKDEVERPSEKNFNNELKEKK